MFAFFFVLLLVSVDDEDGFGGEAFVFALEQFRMLLSVGTQRLFSVMRYD